MSKLDKENLQALREMRNLGKVIELATKFEGLLLNYPQARHSYYYGE